MNLPNEFLNLFDGSDIGHAKTWLTGRKREDGKVDARVSTYGSWEKKQPMTLDMWEKHLSGEQMFGVPPLRSDNKVKWVAVDVDDYAMSLEEAAKKVADNKLPFIVFRSKSGGCHIYCFFEEWIDASKARKKMEILSGPLGWADQELFPKQDRVDPETLPIGNWINMPYFNADQPVRFAYDEKGKPLSAEDFIAYAKKKAIDEKKFLGLTIKEKSTLPSGPPCLQTILKSGSVEVGGRNTTLFNIGVYCQKADPDGWEKLLDEYYFKFFKETNDFGKKDLAHIKRSLKRNEYTYQCSQDPLKRYCQRSKCIGCKFGVGRETQLLPKYGTATKLMSDPPLWYVTLNNGERVVVSSEQLQNSRMFQRACMDQISKMPPALKSEEWTEVVRPVVENASVEFPPEGSTPAEQFVEHLENFLDGTNHPHAEEIDHIAQGKPFPDGSGSIYFRLQDLKKYLQRFKFNDLGQREVTKLLHELGVQSKQITASGQRIRVYVLPISSLPSNNPYTANLPSFTEDMI